MPEVTLESGPPLAHNVADKPPRACPPASGQSRMSRRCWAQNEQLGNAAERRALAGFNGVLSWQHSLRACRRVFIGSSAGADATELIRDAAGLRAPSSSISPLIPGKFRPTWREKGEGHARDGQQHLSPASLCQFPENSCRLRPRLFDCTRTPLCIPVGVAIAS